MPSTEVTSTATTPGLHPGRIRTGDAVVANN